jgi:hypothetical protein
MSLGVSLEQEFLHVRTPSLLITLRLRRMTWFSTQLHNRAVDEVVQPIMGEESLRLGDLHLVRATLPYTLIVRCDGVFQCRFAGLYGLQGFH